MFTNSVLQVSIRVSNVLDGRIIPALKAIDNLCEQFMWVGVFHSEMIFHFACAVGYPYCVVDEIFQDLFHSLDEQDGRSSHVWYLQYTYDGWVLLSCSVFIIRVSTSVILVIFITIVFFSLDILRTPC